MYNIFTARSQKVDETFYDRYQVYFNPCEVNPQAVTKYLVIKVVDVLKCPEEEQLRVHDFIRLLMEECLPETRLTAAGQYTWEIITNFVRWHEEFEIYIPLYHWFAKPQVEIKNGLVWSAGDKKYYLSQVFQDIGYPRGVHYDANTNMLVPNPMFKNLKSMFKTLILMIKNLNLTPGIITCMFTVIWILI